MLFEINFLIFFISPGGQLVDSVVNLKKIKDYNFNGSTAASTKLANTWIFIHILLWKIGNCPAQMAGGMRGVTCVE